MALKPRPGAYPLAYPIAEVDQLLSAWQNHEYGRLMLGLDVRKKARERDCCSKKTIQAYS